MPPPRPVHPGVMFDMLKIRRLVDEAAKLLVHADGNPLDIVQSQFGAYSVQRLREMACQKLSEAYRVDETLCSVLTLQPSAGFDDVASQVLDEDPSNYDAEYVHFFHEKTKPQQLPDTKSLALLQGIMLSGHKPEALRTRAAVRVFMGGFRHHYSHLTRPISDLTSALFQHRFKKQFGIPLPPKDAATSRNNVDMEFGEMTKLLCERLGDGSAPKQDAQAEAKPESAPSVAPKESRRKKTPKKEDVRKTIVDPKLIPECLAFTRRSDPQSNAQYASERLLRVYARLAKDDLMDFICNLQYSPDWPVSTAADFVIYRKKVVAGENARKIGLRKIPQEVPQNRIYQLSDLFARLPPANLPPYPPEVIITKRWPEPATNITEITSAVMGEIRESPSVCEIVTYHPLLLEALHALLLCHCLLRTPPEEIQQHAYMVARLSRLCDGFPAFEVGYPSSRYDWIDVLKKPTSKTGLLPLVATWEELCSPKYLMMCSNSAGTRLNDVFDAVSSQTVGVNAEQSLSTAFEAYLETVDWSEATSPKPTAKAVGKVFDSPGSRLPLRSGHEIGHRLSFGTGCADLISRWLNAGLQSHSTEAKKVVKPAKGKQVAKP
ncbi:hypothetical protein NLG97_g6256 [Lecanicillium saksenae]|uniref:Uncharacterized protein n=1 Tax=Lecanicillium saksenae TaxID=468837 RepID=A0ACC1QTA2_9HYPO|nr:hypothetical protein NLG97_g6256 [Lecanicillium saksenae]